MPTWVSSKEGELYLIIEETGLMIPSGKSVYLLPGEIVLSMGVRDIDGDMLYLTTHGVGALPDDSMFYNSESHKM